MNFFLSQRQMSLTKGSSTISFALMLADVWDNCRLQLLSLRARLPADDAFPPQLYFGAYS